MSAQQQQQQQQQNFIKFSTYNSKTNKIEDMKEKEYKKYLEKLNMTNYFNKEESEEEESESEDEEGEECEEEKKACYYCDAEATGLYKDNADNLQYACKDCKDEFIIDFEEEKEEEKQKKLVVDLNLPCVYCDDGLSYKYINDKGGFVYSCVDCKEEKEREENLTSEFMKLLNIKEEKKEVKKKFIIKKSQRVKVIELILKHLKIKLSLKTLYENYTNGKTHKKIRDYNKERGFGSHYNNPYTLYFDNEELPEFMTTLI